MAKGERRSDEIGVGEMQLRRPVNSEEEEESGKRQSCHGAGGER